MRTLGARVLKQLAGDASGRSCRGRWSPSFRNGKILNGLLAGPGCIHLPEYRAQRIQLLARACRRCDSCSIVPRNLAINDQAPPQSHLTAMLVFHSCYATVLKATDARYDVRGYLLSQVVSLCLGNRATVPLAYRDQYDRCVQREALTFVEYFTARLLFGSGRFSPHEYRYQTE